MRGTGGDNHFTAVNQRQAAKFKSEKNTNGEMPSSPTPSPALKLELPDFVKTNYLIILFPLFLFFGLIVWLAVWGKRVAEKGVHRQLQQQPAAAVAHGREPANNAIGDQAGGLRRRAAAAGTAVAAGGDDVHAEASDEEDNDIDDNEGGGGGDAGPTKAPKRIGKKKALSLQRKEDRRRHNDFLEMQRDDRLRRQELIEEEAEKRAAIELKAQQAEEAREQREKDKRARQEAKEFQVWKRQMGVDEAGHEEEIGRDGGDAKGLESSLIDYIKVKHAEEG